MMRCPMSDTVLLLPPRTSPSSCCFLCQNIVILISLCMCTLPQATLHPGGCGRGPRDRESHCSGKHPYLLSSMRCTGMTQHMVRPDSDAQFRVSHRLSQPHTLLSLPDQQGSPRSCRSAIFNSHRRFATTRTTQATPSSSGPLHSRSSPLSAFSGAVRCLVLTWHMVPGQRG